MSNKNSSNDYLDSELDEMEPVLEVIPTLRGRLFEIMISLGIAIALIYLLKKIPPYGVYLDQLFGLKMKLLHFKISYNVIAWPLKIIAAGSSLFGFYVFLQQKLTIYKLTDLYVEYTRGVISRTSDSTDLVDIRDQRLFRSLLDRILGISKVTIVSKDITDPELVITGISSADAQKIINFLRKYAFKSYTELRISQEKEQLRKSQKSRKTKKNNDDDDMLGLDKSNNPNNDN